MLLRIMVIVCFFFPVFRLEADLFRTQVAGNLEVSLDNAGGASLPLGINSSAVISLGEETRFFRGIELALSAPQRWLDHRGALAAAIYVELDRRPSAGAADLEARRIALDPLPAKIQTIYQIPIRSAHGLRTSPYVTVTARVVLPASFPILFRLMPVIKGLSEELETMIFQLSVKPVLSDEGAVKLGFRYPEQLQGKPFTVFIDDILVEKLSEERLLKEGEHHLVVLSDNYRNESRRFVVERAKIQNLTIELKDPTPLVIFEAPENARVFWDNAPIARDQGQFPVVPGHHEAKFQVGDYTIIKSLVIERGKTYRIVLAVDINVLEND